MNHGERTTKNRYDMTGGTRHASRAIVGRFRTFLLALLLSTGTFPVGELRAQEDGESGYTLIGSVSADSSFTFRSWDPNASVRAAWTTYADLTHRFTAENSGLTLVHRTAFGGSSAVPFPLSTELYEAYLMLRPIPELDVFLGRKRLNIGTGFLYTAGDTFNPASGFFDQKTGGLGFLFSYSPTSRLGLAGGVSAERVFAVAKEFDPDLLDWSLQGGLLLDALQLQAGMTYGKDRTFNPTAGFSYDLEGIILTGEAALEFLPRGSYVSGNVPVRYESWTEPKPSAAAGIRYTAANDDAELTLAGEYVYSGQSWTKDETDAWKILVASGYRDAAPLLPAGFRNRHNAVLRLQLFGWTKLSLSAVAVVNCVDGSVLLNSSASYSPWENVDLAAAVIGGFGEEGTEREYIRGAAPSKMNLTLTARYHF